MFTTREFKRAQFGAVDERLLAKLCAINLYTFVFWVSKDYFPKLFQHEKNIYVRCFHISRLVFSKIKNCEGVMARKKCHLDTILSSLCNCVVQIEFLG